MQLPTAEIAIEATPRKSEFAVLVDDAPVFSRLEQRRFPELDELLAICRKLASL